ncbi:WecB/TagA/CpsF family glycosyltransferase [Cerasibacillus sp. JNUCC 74]|jgi:N-acetylglucosaminyldiphosphoundecaprenol N-acetyl-beta-D-mannosaminyltransferase|uniref:WecB/TagA/CpsF family glycosyltransferase n=1 Tax=Virgibacillus proomii TaxID=84407 RepID=UPI0009874F59|nr:WecB/TagA/CpsF family glycosyltransferase [Virgibacillus proomii]
MKFVTIMNVPFLNTNQRSFVLLLQERIEKKQKTFVITANPEIVMRANKSRELMQHIQLATFVVADGIGIVKAAKILKQPLPERVTGYDTMIQLLKIANKNSYKIFLIGAKQKTLKKAIEKINTDYPNIKIVGSQDGYFNWEDNDISERIMQLQPDITFVALGSPKQEKWIANNISYFKHGIFIGVGGSFDVISGTVKRAPVLFQKLNLEWLYRLIKQPSRWKRMLVLPQFAIKIFKQKLKGKTS